MFSRRPPHVACDDTEKGKEVEETEQSGLLLVAF